MPSSSPSLRERYARDLRSGSLAVTATAVVLAVPAGLGFAQFVGDFEGGFALLILIGVFVPLAHENHWAQDESWERNVAWGVGGSVVAGVLFGAGYLLAGTVLSDAFQVTTVAFLFAVVVGWLLLWLAPTPSGPRHPLERR